LPHPFRDDDAYVHDAWAEEVSDDDGEYDDAVAVLADDADASAYAAQHKHSLQSTKLKVNMLISS
jgi:hypothetical protein